MAVNPAIELSRQNLKRIGQCEMDDIIVQLYGGIGYTLRETERILRDRDYHQAYAAIAGKNRSLTTPFGTLKLAVLGHIQSAWYEAAGKPVPLTVAANQAQRLEDAIMGKTTQAEAGTEGSGKKAKAPRTTIKSVITAGLLAGNSDEAITKALTKEFPDAAAAREPAKHIGYYRHFLIADGKLEKVEKVKKEKPAKEPKAPKDAPAVAAAAPAKGGKKK